MCCRLRQQALAAASQAGTVHGLQRMLLLQTLLLLLLLCRTVCCSSCRHS
jgi:hypothetical protein